MRLTDIPLNQWHSVAAIDGAGTTASPDAPGLGVRLQALGFWVGEPVRLLRRSWLKRGPLVVQIGNATFALRQDEAQCIAVSKAEQAP